MGIPWDGTGMNCYGIGWDETEKIRPMDKSAVFREVARALAVQLF